MDARIVNLIESFQNNGWKSLGVADVKQDWWFEDIIILQSVWRPVGTNIYLTLLTDPGNIKKKIVWEIGISLALPNDRSTIFIKQISLNDIKKMNLTELVYQINEMISKRNN